MAINSDTVIPTKSDSVAAPAKAAKGDDTGLPEDVLKLPVINSLLNGSPPAVYAPRDAKIPEVKVLDKYPKELQAAGFAAYGTSDKENVVFFNQLYVSPEEIKAADAEGTLIGQLAIPYEELAAGYENAKLKEGETPSEALAAAPTVPAGGMPAPAPASVANKLATARIANTAIGSPTSGPTPGQGRILSALRPVI